MVNKNIEPGGGGGPNSCYGRWGRTAVDDAAPRGLAGPIVRALGPLKRQFGYPPFSVFNTRDGDWQARKRAWIALGIRSEVGRDASLATEWPTVPPRRTDGTVKNEKGATGTSIFDPVLCELAYRWWCPPGGIVVDPFAGGSVRGIVAAALGLKYWGSDLSAAQIEANRQQRAALAPLLPGKARWVCGDSAATLADAPEADFLLTCPPYGNLEIYSDDPADISNRPYVEFLAAYRDIVAKAAARLRDNRFACVVVGNFRARGEWQMRDLAGDTVRAFAVAGAEFYNEIILLNAVGTGAVRAQGNFVRGARKVVKCHQNVLVFVKGSPQEAAKAVSDA